MRIGFDARMIGHSGIGVYSQSLLREMISLEKGHSWTLMGPEKMIRSLMNDDQNVRVLNCQLPIYSVWEQIMNPMLLEKFDVLHVPHYNIPLGYRGKLVVTLHDLAHLKMPEFLPSRFAYPYAKFMIGQAYQKSKAMICVSKSTQDDLVRFFGQKGARCQVIHESVRPEFLEVSSREARSEVRSRYLLPERFVLFVGILKPHKNIIRLIRALREIRGEGLPHYHLVIIGKRFERHPEVIHELQKGIRERWVRHVEEVADGDLPVIYQMADLFCLLSLHEGFGLPILEAFASGVPVLASNTSSIPEIAGSGAMLVDPENDAQIRYAIATLLKDKSLRDELIQKGKEELKRFSWRKAAEETLKVYAEVGETH